MIIDKSKIVHAVEACFPHAFVLLYRDIKYKVGVYIFRQKYDRIENRIKRKGTPLKVVFLAINSSVWKYEHLYKLMEADPNFQPLVLVCPQVYYGEEFMWKQMKTTLSFFKEKGYNVKSSYDEVQNAFINLKELQPDVLMYTNPYKGLIMKKYYLGLATNALTCYISYYYPKGITGYHKWLLLFESKLWMNFIASSAEYQRVIHKDNCRVVGYPMYEAFKDGSYSACDWKSPEKKYKRVIWAPYHHIVTGDADIIQGSTFLRYADFMWELAIKYQNSVQFVFKPHPHLRSNLEAHPDWGKEKTDAYYEMWKNGINTNLAEGEYIDLFNTSDALIHDCGSFAVEYLYINKPAMFLAFNKNYLHHLESTGIEALECHEIGFNEEDINGFVRSIINLDQDKKESERNAFYQKHLLPPNGLTASENMLNEIKNKLRI